MVVLMPLMPRLVGLLVIVGLMAVPDRPADAAGQAPRVVRIVAERFTFSPSQVRVTRGTTVEFRLRSEDTNHGFRIPSRNIDVVIPKRGRGEVVVRFEATEAGRFAFECSKPCGAGHTVMRGEIIVEES
jgi:cytochrome c oxidase subunit 2